MPRPAVPIARSTVSRVAIGSHVRDHLMEPRRQQSGRGTSHNVPNTAAARAALGNAREVHLRVHEVHVALPLAGLLEAVQRDASLVAC